MKVNQKDEWQRDARSFLVMANCDEMIYMVIVHGFKAPVLSKRGRVDADWLDSSILGRFFVKN